MYYFRRNQPFIAVLSKEKQLQLSKQWYRTERPVSVSLFQLFSICSLYFPGNPLTAFGKSTQDEKENCIFRQSIWDQSLQRWKFPSLSGQHCSSVRALFLWRFFSLYLMKIPISVHCLLCLSLRTSKSMSSSSV